MITITLRQRPAGAERFGPPIVVSADTIRPTTLTTVSAAESDVVALTFLPPFGSRFAFRVYVGSVLVASSLPADRVRLIEIDDTGEDAGQLVCRGRFFADWVGLTELVIHVLAEDWLLLLTVPVAVSAGKMATEQFDQLFADLERESSAVLLDIHGKTQLGLKATQSLAPSAPLAVLNRLRETVRELNDQLHLMARQPASRLRTTPIREHALAGQTISDDTLAEACSDPSMLVRYKRKLAFREHVRQWSQPDYRILEHQVIADFAEFLKSQLADLRQRIDAEVEERTDRKRWRNVARDTGLPTWWESEDAPRIDELQRCRQEMSLLHRAVERWSAFPFLPPGRGLRQRPTSTPLFRDHPVYRRVFRVMASHFLRYQATLDTQPLMTRARSLPQLYEWWCAVRVMRILSRGLRPVSEINNRSVFATRLAQQNRRLTIEFTNDQAVSFTDGRGKNVRFRYQPAYSNDIRGPVCVLDDAALRTPDLAVEVSRLGIEDPDLIVVLDAKYSSVPQTEKLAEVTTKYSRIGNPRTGRILSRQVWALTPVAPERPGAMEGLAKYSTVDNVAFWSGQFDAENPVNGAVQARPVGANAFDPLQALLATVLRLAGVAYGEGL